MRERLYCWCSILSNAGSLLCATYSSTTNFFPVRLWCKMVHFLSWLLLAVWDLLFFSFQGALLWTSFTMKVRGFDIEVLIISTNKVPLKSSLLRRARLCIIDTRFFYRLRKISFCEMSWSSSATKTRLNSVFGTQWKVRRSVSCYLVAAYSTLWTVLWILIWWRFRNSIFSV